MTCTSKAASIVSQDWELLSCASSHASSWVQLMPEIPAIAAVDIQAEAVKTLDTADTVEKGNTGSNSSPVRVQGVLLTREFLDALDKQWESREGRELISIPSCQSVSLHDNPSGCGHGSRGNGMGYSEGDAQSVASSWAVVQHAAADVADDEDEEELEDLATRVRRRTLVFRQERAARMLKQRRRSHLPCPASNIALSAPPATTMPAPPPPQVYASYRDALIYGVSVIGQANSLGEDRLASWLAANLSWQVSRRSRRPAARGTLDEEAMADIVEEADEEVEERSTTDCSE